MRILIIGGKRFVGYHIAKTAIENHHEVVFFNRGKTNPELFPECETVIGDRNTDMNRLEGYEFDYIIDTCAYLPSQVEKSLDVLEGHFKKYLLISTLSVVTPKQPGFDEHVSRHTPDYTSTEVTMETYGPLKSACEEVLEKRIGDQGIIIRPGYIVGDKDYTYRFSYLPILMHFLDEVIVPKTNNLRYSFIDGSDLASFVIQSLISNLSGIYHTVGPNDYYYDDYVQHCMQVVNPDVKLVIKDDDWFKDNDIIKPIAFPTCNDSDEGNIIFTADTTKAQSKGLTFRPVEDSIRDGLQYFLHTEKTIDELKVGMNYNQMKEHLKK